MKALQLYFANWLTKTTYTYFLVFLVPTNSVVELNLRVLETVCF